LDLKELKELREERDKLKALVAQTEYGSHLNLEEEFKRQQEELEEEKREFAREKGESEKQREELEEELRSKSEKDLAERRAELEDEMTRELQAMKEEMDDRLEIAMKRLEAEELTLEEKADKLRIITEALEAQKERQDMHQNQLAMWEANLKERENALNMIESESQRTNDDAEFYEIIQNYEQRLDSFGQPASWEGQTEEQYQVGQETEPTEYSMQTYMENQTLCEEPQEVTMENGLGGVEWFAQRSNMSEDKVERLREMKLRLVQEKKNHAYFAPQQI